MSNGEFAAISAIRATLGDPPPGVDVWIGDDAAVVGSLLMAVDTVVAGVHADLSLTGLDDLGWKAVAASVSDIAAMGGRPGHALVAVSAPPEVDLLALHRGVAEAAAAFSCPVVGGDLTNGPAVVVTVAVTGTVEGRAVTRSGARPGDWLWVTGPVGASAAGLRLLRTGHPGGGPEGAAMAAHARPVARLEAGRAARQAGATAMIDVSDGLAADLSHLGRASGVGVALDLIPCHPAATLEEGLGGGEDYALAFAAPDPVAVEQAFRGLDTPIRVGRCTADAGEQTLAGSPLAVAGWEHRWSNGSGL